MTLGSLLTGRLRGAVLMGRAQSTKKSCRERPLKSPGTNDTPWPSEDAVEDNRLPEVHMILDYRTSGAPNVNTLQPRARLR
jgi:hypothetical protein